MRSKLIHHILIVSFIGILNSNAQSYWELDKNIKSDFLDLYSKEKKETRISFANLDIEFLKKQFKKLKFSDSYNFKSMPIYFPNEKNQLEEFEIQKASVMSYDLSKKYDDIISFIGVSVLRSEVKIRGTFSPLGLSAMIISDKTIIYIQPEKKTNKKRHIYYENKNEIYESYNRLNCLSGVKDQNRKISDKKIIKKQIINQDRKLKTFRIAVSATSSYTDYWGDDNDENGTNQKDAFAAVVSTINRVNHIFETDLGIHLELVSSDSLIYSDYESQPYKSQFSNYGNDLQKTLSEKIGESNYDVGHLFAYSNIPDGSSGCIGCVCVDGQKGRGYSTHPFVDISGEGFFLNDYFDVDFVAHEVAHQFGAHHTFSYETEGTGVNVEPGSGSTLMGYAGITNKDDLQNHSDPYLHFVSIEEINKNIESKTCQTFSTISNSSPSVNAGFNTYIPIGTAYELSAIATDTDGDLITYTWEQLDSGRVNNLNYSSDLILGSINRSNPPSLSSKRVIPNMRRVLSGELTESRPGLNSDWESVSTVGRILNWGVTVRDRRTENNSPVGQIAQDKIRVTVVENSTPFKIISQNVSTTLWGTGGNEKIEWIVGESFNMPINTKTISILLSIDGGETFPIKLLSNTPNDGEAYISVPENISTSNARIKIVAENSIYFAVNLVDFKIEMRDFSFSFEELIVKSCESDTTSISFEYKNYLDFNKDVSFEILNIPNDLTYQIFPPKTSIGNTNVNIIFSDLSKLNSGNYNIILQGKAEDVSYSTSFEIQKRNSSLIPPEIISPKDDAIDQGISTIISWTSQEDADKYQFQLSENIDFEDLIIDKKNENNLYQLNDLKSQTKYFWRVRAINSCATGTFSDVYNFTTQLISCKDFDSENMPITLQDASANNIGITYANLDIPYNYEIEDLNVYLSINHSYLSDLTISLISPKGKEVILSKNIGGDKKNYVNTTFDDEAEFLISTGSPPFTGIFKPFEKLNQFKGTMSYGNWRLKIVDKESEDSGKIISFGIGLCLRGDFLPNDDKDSIPNDLDNCPLIANEDQLDSNLNGIGDICDIEDSNNFIIYKNDVTCINKNNGSITINAKAKYEYLASIVGPNGYSLNVSFSNLVLEEKNLKAGEYLICITSPSKLNFERCFTAKINEPEELGVISSINYVDQNVNFSLNGAKQFYIKINDTEINVTKSSINLALKKGLNYLEVKTDLYCQGTYKEYIFIEDESLIYPNPVQDLLSILVGGNKSEIEYSIFDLQGILLIKNRVRINNGNRKIDLKLDELITGSYILKLNHGNSIETLKFLKK